MSIQTSPAPRCRDRASHSWFGLGPARFAIPLDDLVGIETLPAIRPLPLTDRSLLGFGLIRHQILPVFDPLSLAGLSLAQVTLPVTVAVAGAAHRPLVAFVCTEAGGTIDLIESQLAPAGGRIAGAFRGEQSSGDASLLVLDPLGLARIFGFAQDESPS